MHDHIELLERNQSTNPDDHLLDRHATQASKNGKTINNGRRSSLQKKTGKQTLLHIIGHYWIHLREGGIFLTVGIKYLCSFFLPNYKYCFAFLPT